MLALLLAVTLSSVAPDPVQTPGTLLSDRLGASTGLDLAGPLATSASLGTPSIDVCTPGVARPGTLWGSALALDQAMTTPACQSAGAFGSANYALSAFGPAMPLGLPWVGFAVPPPVQARVVPVPHVPAAWTGLAAASPVTPSAPVRSTAGSGNVRVERAPMRTPQTH